MAIEDIRNKYPQYGDMSDDQLLQGIYNKSYSDIGYEDFLSRIGVSPAEPKKPRTILERITRQVGLTARNAAEGLAETADIVTDPIKEGLNLIPGIDIKQSTGEMVSSLADSAGLPKPEGGMERIVGQASKLVAGMSPFIKAGQMMTTPLGKVLSSQPEVQLATAGAAGAGGEAEKLRGGGVTSQLTASLVAGLTPAGAKALTMKAIKAFTPMSTEIDDIIMGLDLKGVPVNVIQNIRQRVQRALDIGEVDGDALKRLADYAKTGTTATRAKISRDPVDFTLEENLARQGANSTNPSMQQLARVKNENTLQLISGLDDIAKGTGLDLYKAGEVSISTINSRNKALKTIQGALYDKARDTTGRALPLNRSEFINRVDIGLREGNLTSYLPAEVKAMINEIAYGQKGLKGGEVAEVPFNVDVINTLESLLATEQRAAKGSAKAAISVVKKALMDTNIDGTASKESMKAFRQARNFSRKLFQWQEKSPAIKAIIDGSATPDDFVKSFIIGSGAKSSVSNVGKLMAELRGNPEARAIVQNQVAAWIKQQATSQNAGELAILSQAGLRNALNKIGDRKLNILFGENSVKQLKTIQRVASYEMAPPAGAAVNQSNSANTAIGAMASWAEKWTAALPAINLIIKPTARSVGNWREAPKALLPEVGKEIKKQAPPLAAPLLLGAVAQE